MQPSSHATQGLASVPTPRGDYFLLALRWLIFGGVSVITLSSGRSAYEGAVDAGTIVSPWLATLIIAAYYIPVSFFVWRHRPLVTGRMGGLLLADGVLATIITVLTGGGGSLFSLLFVIPIVEAGLAYRWRAALALIATIGLCSLLASLPLSGGNAGAAAVTTVKFLFTLLLGLLVTVFSEQVRQEYTVRQAALLATVRMAVLNEISLRLGESQLEPERILTTTLESTHVLPDIAFSLVMLSDPVNQHWYVAASTTERHPVGQRVPKIEEGFTPYFGPAGSGPARPQPALYLAGGGATRPLPQFVVDDGIIQLVGVPLILPTGAVMGAIALGRQTDRPLSDDEQLFLRSLALEAGLALRNAQLYSREQDQVERLRRFEALRATFFSATAHELKTPLTVLKTLAPTLTPLPHLPSQTQNEISQTFAQNLERLELLVTDMLESVRLEAGTVALHPRSLDLAGRTRRVLERLTPLLERKQQKFEFHAPAHLPLVYADGKRVEQILSNLIDNAAKFAPPASVIEVSLSQHCPSDGPGLVQAAVADAGPGVPPRERELIFDRFYSTADRALAGVGLGLFICRELVRLHGGRIWVEDRPGGGSRFCFTLPLTAEEIDDEESQPQNSNH